MENILQFLRQLELSDIEAKLYLTLLQQGPTSVRTLAETIDIKRTTAYFYIDQLVDKGLITKLVKESKKLVAANPPENLRHLVEQKVITAKQVEQNFPKILETLTATLPQDEHKGETEITYYKGKNAVQKIYEEALQTNELRSYVKLEETGGVFQDNLHFFNEAFQKNPHLKVREILYNTPSAKEQAPIALSKDKHYSYKFMPPKIKLRSGDVLIYNNKVAIITYKETISSVVLHNEDYYNNSKELFDFIWEILPERI